MKTFIKQIEKACKNYYYSHVVKSMQIKDDYSNTKVAIVAIKETEKQDRYYTIFYKFDSMKKPDYIGKYLSVYNEKHECIYNAYIDACEEFAKYAN